VVTADIAADKSEPTHGWSIDVPDIVQQTASPSFTLTLTGFGVRVADRVDPPLASSAMVASRLT
jgi:hypothetical protein